jgi:CheY-like chemotaxis protein
MQVKGIPACYYPTTVVFVDDSKDFLLNFSLQFNPLLSYHLFDAPQTALKFLTTQRENYLDKRCVSQYENAVGCPTTTHTINVDLSAIHREVYDPKRFSEVSVVVVDYAMPDMNGLDFCKQLSDRPIKKILLTGQANAETAVRGFNEGIIDYFIIKSDPKVIEKINTAITELQRRYFEEKFDFMVQALAIQSPNFLQDSAFAEMFYQLCERYQIVEYYLTENTGTFLMLSASGVAHWLIVCSQQDLEMYIELGTDISAPADVLDKLKAGSHIPHFWQTSGSYMVDPIEWDSYIYPAEKLFGRELYYFAVVENPPISNLDTGGISPYNKYLEQIDNSPKVMTV